jgi:hypothetical protein
MCGGHGQVEVARLLDRLAAIEGFRDCEFAGPVLQQPGDAEQVFAAFFAGELAPGLEGGGGGLIGGIDIGRIGHSDFREFLAIPW